jgi:hypothetical protein
MFNFNANLAFHMMYFTIVFYDMFNPKEFGCPCVSIMFLDNIFNLLLFGYVQNKDIRQKLINVNVERSCT